MAPMTSGEPMNFTDLEKRYHNDNAFHIVVDTLQSAIMEMHLSPSEVRDAAMFAAYLVESRRGFPMPIVIVPNDPRDHEAIHQVLEGLGLHTKKPT